ncbi:MAG: PDZ domain-containing protein [Candidatus Cloacimonetes bacterium]|nr:PDZ domain-containing protein [Candidatus Cloacimonadota bacterium]
MKQKLLIMLMLIGIGHLMAEYSYEGKVERSELLSQSSEEVVLSENEESALVDNKIELNNIAVKMNDAFMGILPAEMTLVDAVNLGYTEFYGILVNGVVPNSSAKFHRILKNDIIMQIDAKKVENMSVFSVILSEYHPGDTIEVKLFRNKEVRIIKMTLGIRGVDYDRFLAGDFSVNEKNSYLFTEKYDKHQKKSVGYGGGSWIPVWFTPDYEEINKKIAEIGFKEIKKDGIFLNGGGGQGNIGQGFFLGGMGAGYSKELTSGTRKMAFSVGYGGITLDKRFAITSKIVSSLGFMLGWGGYKIRVTNTNGSYNWDDIAGIVENNNSEVYASGFEMQKNFILFQPKFVTMYRMLSWLSIRAEVGYMMGYSYYDGWVAKNLSDTIEIENSPDTSFNGFTFTIGPWFGF